MDRVRAFVSYSSAEKVIGGKFKSYLTRYCGYETFIAHDDILGSAIWEEEIVKAIERSDFFIPLISDKFKQSDFTDQEIGISICLKKKIIPVKLGIRNPYGFIGKYQALQFKSYPSITLTVAQIGLSYEPKSTYHHKALNSIVHAFCSSDSFDTTNAIIQIMCRCNDFSYDHLEQITQAIKNNRQITEAFGLPTLKKFLLKTYNF